ncbi:MULTISPECIES: GtrA family protein [unclassified Amycolatopsis]|uniref:GtrA family protein n=1 Tax=unclassified Amycolatopsis TaxID=2618356 RepID=UPI002E10107E|nr:MULTISPECIES: GtrA family protein [unclassified Amycolatopsis]WSK80155.1 GtrA family protein [Amycolatopsis sp. NBC_01286]
MRELLKKHRELLRFAVVGGISFVITMSVNYGLKFTVLRTHPVTALMIGVLVATIFSYVANREWSFRTRGGRERHHEAALFFLISGIALGLNALPQWFSRYVLHLQAPQLSPFGVEVADFVSGIIIGTLLGTVFRWWAFKKWVFPDEDARTVAVAAEAAEDPDIHGSKAA